MNYKPNNKRTWTAFDASQGTPAQASAAVHQSPKPQKRFVKKLSSKKLRQAATHLVKEPDMTELVEYIYTHEEAFKNQNRIASLYSDFRGQRDTNPDGYLANLNAWRKALEHATRAGVVPGSGTTKNLLIIDTSNEFARALQHKQYGLPTCLREVFLDAIKKGAFVPVPDWTTSTQSIYHKSWFTIPKIPTVGGVLSGAWEIGKSSIFGPSTQLPAGSFVVVANVEAVAEAILNDYRSQPHTSTADRIFSKTAFWKRFGDAPSTGVAITARDLDVLLVHMSRDKQVLSVSGNTIKFKAETEDQPSPVVQEDEAIAELHDAIETAKKRLVLLQANATKFGLAAKEAVQIKQIVRAKTCLRRKKMAETSLEHYTNLSLQLEESYSKLQQAADQVGIIEAMKAGAEAMATLNLKVGGVEGVQKVVDAVNEEMATTDEITNIINESADPVDEEEIDDELAEMERTEKEKKEREDAARAAERLAELPEAKKARIEEGHEAAKATESPADARQEREGEDLETDEIASQLSTVDIREPQEKKSEERVPMAA